jgi:lipopolysaccharide export system protein LptA
MPYQERAMSPCVPSFELPLLSQRGWHALAAGMMGLGLWLAQAPALADTTDREQPMSFAADSVRVDEKKRLNILLGNVEVSKGTIVVRADRIEVLQGTDGSQKATASGGASGRALFRQRREGRDEAIEGEAEKVEYNSRTDEVRFVGRATMRRLIGGSVVDEVAGQTIVYDNKTDIFQVAGGQGSAAPQGRVRGVIGPRKPVLPGASAGDGANLQSSSTLTPPVLRSTP